METTLNIEITINGETRHFAAGVTMTELIAQLQLTPERIAIEYNRAILARRCWGETELQTGDALEIVQFVGGG